MVSMTGIRFPIKALRAQIASAINVVVQIARLEDGRRRIVSLQANNGLEGEIVTMSELFKFERQSIDEDNNVIGELRPTGIVPGFYRELQRKGIEIPIQHFGQNM